MKLAVYDAKVAVTAWGITTSSRIYLRGEDIMVRKGTDEIPDTIFRLEFPDVVVTPGPLEVIKVYGTGKVTVDTAALSRYTLKLVAIANGAYDNASITIQGPDIKISRVVMESCSGLIYGFPVSACNSLNVCSTGSGLIHCTRQPGCLLNESGQSVTVHTEQ